MNNLIKPSEGRDGCPPSHKIQRVFRPTCLGRVSAWCGKKGPLAATGGPFQTALKGHQDKEIE